MKLLELVMIVKNSGNILKQCLKENKQYIDHWTIVDTGSTDNTKQIIKDELKGIEGNLYDAEFHDFSQARNESIRLSSKTCKYTIILDDSYIIHGGYKLRQILDTSKAKYLSIRIGQYKNNNLHNEYYSNRIFKSDITDVKYKYRVHEHLDINSNKSISEIVTTGVFINDVQTYEHQNRSVKRYKKDIELLEKDRIDFPNEPRVVYYLAKTYYNMDYTKKSLSYFKELEKFKNTNQEYLFASAYERICIEYFENNDIFGFEQKLLQLQGRFKNRIEPSYKLAVIYKDSDVEKTDSILSVISKCPKPNLVHTLLENEIYDYFIPYLLIDVKMRLGQIEKVIPMLKQMLNIYPTNQPLLNIKYSICRQNISSIILSLTKTIVIHTGGEQMLVKNWNPRGDNRISGSEYMALNLANEFQKIGYRVFVVGSFEDETLKIDNQCVLNNIQYIDYKYFSEFALKYVIDYLVVSRFTANLVYYDNVKNVYLWCHDVLPIMDDTKCFQTHKEKFKGIIAISSWQKNNIVKKLEIPEENIILSRNAIYPERFLGKSINKVPFRFIYSSDPSRGLSYLIKLLPIIKESYPETTLYIFANNENIDGETMQEIEKLKEYVFLHDRVNQEQLAIELLKSDVWFYPTNFEETYCISAVEAMVAKCLVVTVELAALKEIVATRGVLCKYPIEENKERLIEKLFFIFENPHLKEHLINKAFDWAAKQNFESLSEEWIDIFKK